jgi:hypothetical protein
MARVWVTLLLIAAVAGGAVAQEHYTEGPVWRVSLVRVKPNKMDEYLASLRQATKPLLDEEKRNGTILDYKVFLKETTNSPQDWDIALAIEYKNHAALDGPNSPIPERRMPALPCRAWSCGLPAD